MNKNMQFIGAFMTDGGTLSFALGSGFDKLPLEQQREILEYCAKLLEKAVVEMHQDIEALKEGAKADTDNAAIEGDEA